MYAKLRKRCITLIEMMIVMFLIAMITGVIAYNYRGTLEEGKAFKTKAAQEKLETILSLKQAEESDFDVNQWKDYIRNSPYVHKSEALIRDGWGNEFTVSTDSEDHLIISSRGLDTYEERRQRNS